MCKICDILQFESFGKQGNVNKVVVVGPINRFNRIRQFTSSICRSISFSVGKARGEIGVQISVALA